MATSSQAVEIKPGLLLTHNWSQLRTEKGLCNTTITETDSHDFKTVIFPITRRSQYEAFINGQVLCQDVMGCPLKSIGEVPLDCPHDEPFSAVVKVTYRVTHTLSADPGNFLSVEAIEALQKIDYALGQTDNVPEHELHSFLQTFGSHFQYGCQQVGEAFSWMVFSKDECDMELLFDVAKEIFNQELVQSLPASSEGIWHSASRCNTDKQFLKSVDLPVSQYRKSANTIDSVQRQAMSVKGQLLGFDTMNTNTVSVWDLIDKSLEKFKDGEKLKSVITCSWRKFNKEGSYHNVFIPKNPETIKLLNIHKSSEEPPGMTTSRSVTKSKKPQASESLPIHLTFHHHIVTPRKPLKIKLSESQIAPQPLTVTRLDKQDMESGDTVSQQQRELPNPPQDIEHPDTCSLSQKQDVTPENQEKTKPTDICKHWADLIRTLGLDKYFPSGLSLQQIRTLHVRENNGQTPTLTDLPWKVLEHIMFLNSDCREVDIDKFSKTASSREVNGKKTANSREVTGKKLFGKVAKAQSEDRIPHPMDMMLLLFTCSDYMLRQVLARKLFMCRLAIPFIIPTAEDRVEIMLWSLRSIILEWRSCGEPHEEALVKCRVNMVACMRYGMIRDSKSNLMNKVLSSPSHDVFFHQGSLCGNERRLISNGTVEMSHYLPGGSQQDIFKDPALFFNLRGDACDYPVQHSFLLDFATVLVVFIDIEELCKSSALAMLESTMKQSQGRVCVVLTDRKGHDKDEMEKLYELLCERFGDAIDNDLVTTFSTDQGGTENTGTVIQEIREAISKKMVKQPEVSLEQYILSQSEPSCIVDEISNDHCSAGKELANRIETEIDKVHYLERKKLLLPKQSSGLTEMGDLLRKLHRTSAQEKSTEFSNNPSDEITKRENMKLKMQKIRGMQANARNDSFMELLIQILQQQGEPREFAIRFIQLKLDSISRSHLPILQRKKNELWKKLRKDDAENLESAQRLQMEIQAKEKDISEATVGWEHLMREIGQIYEVTSALKACMKGVSFLPELVARQLLEGYPVELMDGDHGILPLEWVKAVFQSLAQLAGENSTIYVVSVVGIQSSGKSTMLNTMFGLEFTVSAGRCTRGIYAQLLPVKENQNLPFDYLLVLDSEGLRSQQREQNYQHDNELATLVIGLSDIALVNMKGENVAEMVDVLQIVVHAFLRMKLADASHKRQCMIIHQNVTAVNAKEKLADDRQRFEEKLNTMTKQASITEGLAECITSFTRIIGFDNTNDFIYFSDLMKGDPPMATINQGYSHTAADTQQRILKDTREHAKHCITIPGFIMRVEDMWKGVLSDDFIFSFRNTLAAKAYIEVERALAAHTFDIEHKLLEWTSSVCKVQIGNCHMEKALHECCSKLKMEVREHVEALVRTKLEELQEFFGNHPLHDIMDQWITEKELYLRTFGETQARQTELDLNNMKDRKLIELHQKHAFEDHKKEIRNRAIALAERMRGKDLSESELQIQFDELWDNWTATLPTETAPIQNQLMDTLLDILREKFNSEGGITFFNKQSEDTPLMAENEVRKITKEELVDKYITVKESKAFLEKCKQFVGFRPKLSDYFDEASQRANQIMETVMQRVETICTQDAQFKRVHGRKVVELLWEEIARHNDLPFDKAKYAFTPQFKAMIGFRVTACAIPKFEQMNQRFEDQYGVEAQVRRYRGRVFRLFQNCVRQAEGEVIASEDFCEALKIKIIDYVHDNVKQNIPASVAQELGTIKFDLIIKILDEIAGEGNFTGFHSYAVDPTVYAEKWLAKYCENHVFTRKDEQTNFSRIAGHAVDDVFKRIVTSTENATKAVLSAHESAHDSEQYELWIEEFCANMTTTIPLNSNELRVATSCNIKNIQNFQAFLKSDMQQLKGVVENHISETTAESAKWLDTTYQKIFQRLWGCREHCPFCKEPCQKADSKHGDAHQCVQHKPSGIRGIHWEHTSLLSTETCNWGVASTTTFKCGVIEYKCREIGKCEDNERHAYREYKTYLPDWDISPDPAGEACKYWQWAMCYFQKELLQKYPENKLEIPGSWKAITKQEAVDSLRVFL